MKLFTLLIGIFSMVLVSNVAICDSMDVEGQDSDVAEHVYDNAPEVSEPSLSDVEAEDTNYNDSSEELALKVKRTESQKQLDDIYREENPDIEDDEAPADDEEDEEIDSEEFEEELSDEEVPDTADDEEEGEDIEED